MSAYQLITRIANGNQDAESFMRLIVSIAHTWDDLIDRDQAVSNDQINDVFWKALIQLPANPFFRQHFEQLHPLMAKAIIDWRAANEMEMHDVDSEVSYILRSAFVDVLTMTALLLHGTDAAVQFAVEIRAETHYEGLSNYRLGLDIERHAREGK